MNTTATPATDTFFGAVDIRAIRALPLGALIRITYDELGARRANRCHTIEGVVTLITEDAERGCRITLAQVIRTRPSGDRTNRDRLVVDGRNVMTLDILEGMAF